MEHESLEQFVAHIIEDGIITSAEHDEFMEMVHADGEIDEQEKSMISKIFSLLSSGQIKVVDEERDSIDRETVEAAKKEAVDSQDTRPTPLAVPDPEEQKKIAEAIKKVHREQEASKNKIDEYFANRESELDQLELKKPGNSAKSTLLKNATEKYEQKD